MRKSTSPLLFTTIFLLTFSGCASTRKVFVEGLPLEQFKATDPGDHLEVQVDNLTYISTANQRRAFIFKDGALLREFNIRTPGPRWRVIFDSYSKGKIGTKAFLVPIEGQFKKDDMETSIALGFLRTALVARGIKTVENIKDSDIVVFMTFGISDPDVDVQVMEIPIIAYDGGTTSTTTFRGSVSGTATTQTSGRGAYVAGYRQRTVKHVTYTRYLHLKAVATEPYMKNDIKGPAWQIRTTTTGETDDLRRALPLHFGTIIENLGTDSGGKSLNEVGESDFYATVVRETLWE